MLQLPSLEPTESGLAEEPLQPSPAYPDVDTISLVCMERMSLQSWASMSIPGGSLLKMYPISEPIVTGVPFLVMYPEEN